MVRASRFSAIARACFLAGLLLGGPIQIIHAQTDWGRYTPGTIAASLQQHESSIRGDHVANHPSLVISGDDFPTLAHVIYRGDSRPLDPKRLEVLREWGLTFLRDTSVVQDFDREYLFQEGKQLFWLPVQDSVASYFARELHSGQQVTLYVVWFGAYYAGRDITWAFIVNEFTTRPIKRAF
jgi:hypothetical protein